MSIASYLSHDSARVRTRDVREKAVSLNSIVIPLFTQSPL